MNTPEQHWYPKGYFPLLIRVEDKKPGCGQKMGTEDILDLFVKKASENYDLHVKEDFCGTTDSTDLGSKAKTPHGTPANCSEKHIAVPFTDRENIRIAYNIFASDIDGKCGDAYRFHFHMESEF